MKFLFSLMVVIILTAPNLHARRRCPKTPENPSAILYLGGSAVVAWRYIKARWIH